MSNEAIFSFEYETPQERYQNPDRSSLKRISSTTVFPEKRMYQDNEDSALDVNPDVATEESHETRRLTRWQGLGRVLSKPNMLWNIFNAQLRLRGAQKLPFSVRLWGRAKVHGGGQVTFGERVRIFGTMVPVDITAWTGGRLEIGHGVFINYGTTISAHELVTIGNDCQIGQEVIINDNDYHDIFDKRKTPPSQPVILEDRVWLAARVIVLKGVHIGHDSVVAAGSLVTKDIPPCSLAMGHPARVVRTWG
jgi:maltose O-acetyltransferase